MAPTPDNAPQPLEQLGQSTWEWHLDFYTSPPEVLRNVKSHPSAADKCFAKALRLTDPHKWSPARKNFTLCIACLATTGASFAASSYSPGAEMIAEELRVGRIISLLGVTVFTLGFAITPMALAPLSEVYGRKPVFTVTGVIYVVTSLTCALTPTFGGLLISRFLAGAGSSTFSTMIGGLIADIYDVDQRNKPMSLFSGSAVLGIGLGPLICGFIAQYTTWRWIFYLQVIVNGILVSIVVLFFKESRATVILKEKAELLNKWHKIMQEANADIVFRIPESSQHPEVITSHVCWKIKMNKQQLSLTKTIFISVIRPFQLLLMDPVVFVFSLWAAFSWSVLYICLSAVPLVFQNQYAFDLSQANATFASPCIATVVATAIGIIQEVMGRRINFLPNTPEARLYFICIEGFLLPIGLFIFGWTCRADIHWIVPTIAIGIATAGIFFVFLAVFNYLADAYGPYASSAIAAQSFCRNVLGGLFPLITRQMYTNMGYGPASSLLGGVAVVLSIVPWILVYFGYRIRGRSRFMRAEEVKE